VVGEELRLSPVKLLHRKRDVAGLEVHGQSAERLAARRTVVLRVPALRLGALVEMGAIPADAGSMTDFR
jgi:hypothetical protein